jgi:sugar/nucleoside kinase (ribokinase family)
VIALLGNLARDVFPDQPPRPGGAPFYAARALRFLGLPGAIYARCALTDRDELLPPLIALGGQVAYVPGQGTASFAIDERGLERQMRVLAIGDSWLPSDLPKLAPSVAWVHVAPLLRSDFPAATLAALARERWLSLDGQGLVRPDRLGELKLDDDYDPALLASVRVLKLSDEEADVVGDPRSLPVPEVIVTHGSAGATVYADGQVENVVATPVAGNHTGTGDAFSIAYIAGRSQAAAPVAAARQAAAVVSAMLRPGS